MKNGTSNVLVPQGQGFIGSIPRQPSRGLA
jgi:hypothetical protein